MVPHCQGEHSIGQKRAHGHESEYTILDKIKSLVKQLQPYNPCQVLLRNGTNATNALLKHSKYTSKNLLSFSVKFGLFNN